MKPLLKEWCRPNKLCIKDDGIDRIKALIFVLQCDMAFRVRFDDIRIDRYKFSIDCRLYKPDIFEWKNSTYYLFKFIM